MLVSTADPSIQRPDFVGITLTAAEHASSILADLSWICLWQNSTVCPALLTNSSRPDC